ncbi:DUF1993 domain-containing protein [Thermosynechococcaceae cyanobacterium BACA0444]|uniref:DUF1993 domain-containing protein n=1 Tax=Pseudocalidococcus azoricus BACA0444 TaxID=2918990 RepID=A0AAE4FTP6_9CYAN|nr:DUF1993 domain-containing protein [Pseudocalidococcus azoricus]MDS3862143.1 DUF1993 domain-containing protein [Pseudocalidococcus azoricus BACA0444]
MQSQSIASLQNLFQSRLATLDYLLMSAQSHFGDNDSFLQTRITADMLPFGTQIVFTCNQPRNFALWCDGKPMDNLDPDVLSLQQASAHISNTKKLLADLSVEDEKLDEVTHIDLGQGLYAELSGSAYVNDFLIPNFYFHMVTAYNILRMAGVPIGKRDYMMHLLPYVRQK